MADYGVTEKGFVRPSYDEVLTELKTRAYAQFGNDIDLESEGSVLLHHLKLVAWSTVLLWEKAEDVYNSGYIDMATGQSLDYAVKYAGLTRRPASKATGQVTFQGDVGVNISANFLVATSEGDIRFLTTEACQIGADGTVTVGVVAEQAGSDGNVIAGAIDTIVNPIPGLTSVTNQAPTTGGLDQETDAELRLRYYESLGRGGAGTVDAIRAAVLELEGVTDCVVFENCTMEDDATGRPPKSIEVVVLGGQDADIAQAIFDTKAAGILAYYEPGEYGVLVQVQDEAGNTHDIGFTRAEQVQIYVDVTVTKTSEYPSDGDQQVEDAIIAYIGGTDNAGQYHKGLLLGEDVIWTELIFAAQSIPGVKDVSILVGTTSPPAGTSNIAIEPKQVAYTSTDAVTVTSS